MDERMTEIQKAMNYFWDCLEGVPGVKAHPAPPKGVAARWEAGMPRTASIAPRGAGQALRDALLPGSERRRLWHQPWCQQAAAFACLFNETDVYGHGKPTRIANSNRDLRQPVGNAR